MQPLRRQIHSLLIKRKITIAVAESCTGGLLSYILTSTPGSSRYFKLSIVAYSNEAKKNTLKISDNEIKKYGAVSNEVALRLAKAVRKIAKTNLGASITGIAGPGGGTKIKPVGLVFIAIADKIKAKIWRFNFQGNRENIRKLAATNALKLIKRWLA